jgi:polysaccharide chain length determinant protein (PEP-CTERM system associated)
MDLLTALSPYSILRMLWKRKWIIVALLVVVAAGGAIYVNRLPPEYEAYALVVIDSQQIPDRYVPSIVNQALQDRMANLTQQILASTRVQKIMDTYRLYSTDRNNMSPEELQEKFRRAVRISLVHGIVEAQQRKFVRSAANDRRPPDAFQVAFRDSDPNAAALVAQQLANAYVEENLKLRETHAAGTSDFLDQQLESLKRTLDEQDKMVTEFKLRHNGELPQQEGALMSTLGRLQNETKGHQDALAQSEQRKANLESSIESAWNTLQILRRDVVNASNNAGPVAMDGTPSRGRAEPAAPPAASEVVRAQLAAASARYTPEHPEVRRLRAELKRLEALEAAQPAPVVAARNEDSGPSPAAVAANANATARVNAAAGVAAAAIQAQTERYESLKAQLLELNSEIESHRNELPKLANMITAYQNRLEKLPVTEQEISSLTRDYDITRSQYKQLLEKKYSADMSAEMERKQQAEKFSVLENAQVPDTPTSPDRPLWYGISAAVGLGLGVVVALALELQRNLFLGEWEVPSDIPILGRVPQIGTNRTKAA